METKRLTATEKEALVRLSVAREILVEEPEMLKTRVSLVPGAKRDIAMMASKINRLLEGFKATIPQEQVSIYEHALHMSRYSIGAKRPGAGVRNDKEYGMWIPFDVLDKLLEGLRDRCDMCSLDKGQRRACALRKAVDTIPNDVPRRDDGDCPYFIL